MFSTKNISLNKNVMTAAVALGTVATGASLAHSTTAHADEISIQNGQQVKTTKDIQKGKAYTVKKGDCLYRIAMNHGITLDQLCRLNNKSVDSVIYPGDVLYVSGTITTTTTPVHTQQTPQTHNTQQTQRPALKQQSQTYTQRPTQKAYTQPVTQQHTNYSNQTSGGSVKQQFLAAGGTEEMWNNIVIPESGGNPRAVNPLGYMGLGQTKESWGTGSVAQQTRGMINYAKSRYGSVQNAINFRITHNYW